MVSRLAASAQAAPGFGTRLAAPQHKEADALSNARSALGPLGLAYRRVRSLPRAIWLVRAS